VRKAGKEIEGAISMNIQASGVSSWSARGNRILHIFLLICVSNLTILKLIAYN
jgi:hypothetical protein